VASTIDLLIQIQEQPGGLRRRPTTPNWRDAYTKLPMQLNGGRAK
jgi:hypothetical protein